MHVVRQRAAVAVIGVAARRKTSVFANIAVGQLRLRNRFFSVARAERERPPDLPEHLQKIVDEYDREQAAEHKWTILHPRLALPLGMGLAGIIAFLLYSIDDVSSDGMPVFAKLISMLETSTARKLVCRLASWDMLPKDYDKDDPYLVIEPEGSGLRFMTPVGLGAGFDREAVGIAAFFNLGFGFADVGPISSTDDIAAIKERLTGRDTKGQVAHFGVLGSVISADTVAELKTLARAMGPHTDYISINLSGGRARDPEVLRQLVADVIGAVSQLPGGGPKLFVRIPPTWPDTKASAQARGEACALAGAAALAGGATGLVLCHKEYIDDSDDAPEVDPNNEVIGAVYRRTGGRLVLVACGGIKSGRDALDRIEAGATVVQISTLLVSEGPQACRRIKDELSALVMNDGHYYLQDAVGIALKKQRKVRRKKPSSFST